MINSGFRGTSRRHLQSPETFHYNSLIFGEHLSGASHSDEIDSKIAIFLKFVYSLTMRKKGDQYRMCSDDKFIKEYYDSTIIRRFNDFVYGNKRVETAWSTLLHWAPENPKRILEIGCSIGATCWKLSNKWPYSEVVGIDISKKSIEIANKLFCSPQISFLEGKFSSNIIDTKFNFIILIDVYEHVPIIERNDFHNSLKSIQDLNSRIFLSFPTPRNLDWLRKERPSEIQPVDEKVFIEDILTLANDTDNDLILYKEVNVWHEGDYAHAVLGKANINNAVHNVLFTNKIFAKLYKIKNKYAVYKKRQYLYKNLGVKLK